MPCKPAVLGAISKLLSGLMDGLTWGALCCRDIMPPLIKFGGDEIFLLGGATAFTGDPVGLRRDLSWDGVCPAPYNWNTVGLAPAGVFLA